MMSSYDDDFLRFLWDNLPSKDRMRVLENSPKTVWIFGAGASHHYGLNTRGVQIPLANGFFEAFHALPTSKGFQAHIGPLINYLFLSRGVRPTDVPKWKENIEDFMTSIEAELDALRAKTKSGEELSEKEFATAVSAATAFNNMSFILANVINEAQNGPSFSAYHELLKFCTPNDTFITFNWDTLLDRALADTGCWSPNDGYSLTFTSILDGNWKPEVDSSDVVNTNLKLLKLHGSTNWLVPFTSILPTTLEYAPIIPEGEKVFLFWQSSLPYSTYRGRWRGGYSPTCYGYYPPSLPFSAFSEQSLSAPPGRVWIKMTPANIFSPYEEPTDKGLVSSPLLITPVRQKQYDKYASTIEDLWKQSEDTLSTTNRIVIVGYSFPPTDKRAMEILCSALTSRSAEITLEIVDPYANDIADRIGIEALGHAKNVKIIAKTFEAYIEDLWQEASEIMKAAESTSAEISKWIQRVAMMIQASPYIHGDSP